MTMVVSQSSSYCIGTNNFFYHCFFAFCISTSSLSYGWPVLTFRVSFLHLTNLQPLISMTFWACCFNNLDNIFISFEWNLFLSSCVIGNMVIHLWIFSFTLEVLLWLLLEISSSTMMFKLWSCNFSNMLVAPHLLCIVPINHVLIDLNQALVLALGHSLTFLLLPMFKHQFHPLWHPFCLPMIVLPLFHLRISQPACQDHPNCTCTALPTSPLLKFTLSTLPTSPLLKFPCTALPASPCLNLPIPHLLAHKLEQILVFHTQPWHTYLHCLIPLLWQIIPCLAVYHQTGRLLQIPLLLLILQSFDLFNFWMWIFLPFKKLPHYHMCYDSTWTEWNTSSNIDPHSGCTHHVRSSSQDASWLSQLLVSQGWLAYDCIG